MSEEINKEPVEFSVEAFIEALKRIAELEAQLAEEKRLREDAEESARRWQRKYNELRNLVRPVLESINRMAEPAGEIRIVLDRMKQTGDSGATGQDT